MLTSVVCSTVPLPSGFTFTSVVLLRHAVEREGGEEHGEDSDDTHRGDPPGQVSYDQYPYTVQS